MLIAIVGIDGVGKTTQIKLLRDSMQYSVNLCKAIPNNRAIIEAIQYDDYITFKETVSLAMAIDLISSYKTQVKDNEINIWDRYKYCIHAYFMAQQILYKKTNILLEQLITPDITIWLKTEPCIAEKRINMRGNVKPLDNVAFLTLVQEQYENVLGDVDNVYTIDCKDLYPNKVHEEIMSIVDNKLKYNQGK